MFLLTVLLTANLHAWAVAPRSCVSAYREAYQRYSLIKSGVVTPSAQSEARARDGQSLYEIYIDTVIGVPTHSRALPMIAAGLSVNANLYWLLQSEIMQAIQSGALCRRHGLTMTVPEATQKLFQVLQTRPEQPL